MRQRGPPRLHTSHRGCCGAQPCALTALFPSSWRHFQIPSSSSSSLRVSPHGLSAGDMVPLSWRMHHQLDSSCPGWTSGEGSGGGSCPSNRCLSYTSSSSLSSSSFPSASRHTQATATLKETNPRCSSVFAGSGCLLTPRRPACGFSPE